MKLMNLSNQSSSAILILNPAAWGNGTINPINLYLGMAPEGANSMIRLSRGDAPVQYAKNGWRHWCRVLDHELTLIFFKHCPHCADLEPALQKKIDEVSAAILREATI